MDIKGDNPLFNYLLWLGDSNLILGHRLSEWCGHGPILEEDIALTNIALDLTGQARLYLTYAGEIEGKGHTEDDFAYLRDVMDYKNCLLAEQPNGDFGNTMVRQFLYTAFSRTLLNGLLAGTDERLSSIAAKSLKEVSYHFRHCSDWIMRLGDGTSESHIKVQNALDNLWMFTGDLFDALPSDNLLLERKIIPDMNSIKSEWEGAIKNVFNEATIIIPPTTYMMKGGRKGKHTEHLGHLLSELQFLPRAYPGAKW